MDTFTTDPFEKFDQEWEPDYSQAKEENLIVQFEDGDQIYIHGIWDADGGDGMGLVQHEHDHGCLDYMIGQTLRSDLPDGYFIIERATMTYYRGDGWTTDNDADLDYENIRPATIPEIMMVESKKTAWKQLSNQLKLHLKFLWGYQL